MPFVQIENSVDQEHIKFLFRNLCDDILERKEEDVRKNVLGFQGKTIAVMTQPITIHDILKACEKLGVKFSVKISGDKTLWDKLKEDKKAEIDGPHETLKESDLSKKMEGQAEDITNPDLKDVTKTPVAKVQEPPPAQGNKINPNTLPDLNF